jgi:hypothetical protein
MSLRVVYVRNAGPRVPRTLTVEALTKQDTPGRRRTNAAWLRAQIDGLTEAIVYENLSKPEIRRALAAVSRGEPWRSATDRKH